MDTTDAGTVDGQGDGAGLSDSYTRGTTVTVTHHGGTMVKVTAVLDDPDHHMTARMDVDVPTRTITAAELEISRAPFPACRGPADAAGQLVGLPIERGFTSKVAGMIGGRTGCSHMFETVVSAARLASSAVTHVAAGSTRWDTMYHEDEKFREAMAPTLRDTCIVFMDHGPAKDERGSGDEDVDHDTDDDHTEGGI